MFYLTKLSTAKIIEFVTDERLHTNLWCMMLTEEERSTWRKICPTANYSTTDPAKPRLELKRVLFFFRRR